jgi:4-hydroxybenzoate polyprenyltransferase
MNRPNQQIVKFIALLSIIRWYNVLIVSLALLFSSVFLLNDAHEYVTTLKDVKLYLSIASVAFLMKAGFIINAFYDFEKDIINRPEETIFGRIISKTFCLNTYVLFIFIGLSLAFLISWKVLFFNFGFSFMLWFYSHKLRKKAFTGELSAALLTVAPFLSLSLYYQHYNLITFLFVGYIFVLTMTREIVKKMISLKGDLIVGEKSLPIVLGIKKTKYILLAWIILASICIASLLPFITQLTIFYYFCFALVMLFVAALFLRRTKTAAQFTRMNNLFKMLLIAAILCIPLATDWIFLLK